MRIEQTQSGAIKTFDWTHLPKGWKFELLGNLVTIRRGASPRPAGDPRFFGGTIPWFKIGDATRSPSRFLSVTEDFVNEEGAKHSVRVPPGSLIISNSGVSLGFAVITQIEGCIHDGWLFLDDFRGVERNYLYYCINFLAPRIRQMADGTTQPNLNTDIARRLLIPLPPQYEQQAIAYTLGAIDDKIALNRRMNTTLEEMCRRIFKSWFVDFDPANTQVEGRQQDIADSSTLALFPHTFEESPVGRIPKGWPLAALGDHVDTTRGLSYSGKGLADNGIPLHNLNSVLEGGGYKYEGLKHYVGEYEERHIVRPGEIIVTNTEQGFDFLLIGFPAIVPKCFGQFGIFSHHLYRVLPKSDSPIKRHFLYWLIMSKPLRSQIIGYTNRTTVNMLPQDGLERPRFVLPPRALIETFEQIAGPLSERIEHNYEESASLARTRDVLLPKLLSGEIRVKKLEAEIARVSL
jgi:type I restriction enzyme S subunit